MKNQETITVVTICFNCLDSLRKTVNSVLGQKEAVDEYIIIDGNSSDGSKEFLMDLQKQNQEIIVVSEPDKGIADAMNKGLKLSTQKWINFMHAGDCFYNNETVAEVREELKNFSLSEYLYGVTQIVDDKGRIIREWDPPMYKSERLKLRNYIPHQTVFFPTAQLKNLNGFDSSIRIAMDYDLWIRSSSKGIHGRKINKIVCRFMDGGLSSQWWPMLMNERSVRLARYEKKLIQSLFDYLYTVIRYIKNLPKSRR